MRFFYIPLLLFVLGVNAQKYDYVWLMGQNSSTTPEFSGTVIDFNTASPDIYYEFRDMYFLQTNASICDTAGNLLFYTNGIYVANALNETMEGGQGLNPGAHATAQNNSGRGYILDQGAMILPVPENDSLYYLLHMDRIVPPETGIHHSSEHLYYTLINMNANNGLGKVIEKNQVISESVYTNGKLTATRHANGRDWWILLRRYDTNRYTRILIDESDFISRNQQIGEPIPSHALGQAVFSPDGNIYASMHIAGAAGDPIYVSIYDFDRCTGTMSEPIQFTYADTAWAGGIAISPNSRFLYVSSYLYLYQYDLWEDDIEASKDTIAVWDGFAENDFFATTFYLAQLAPDGKIYINSNNGVSYLHVINNPDLPGDSCNVCQHCVDLPSVNSASLPNFPNYRLKHLEGSPCDTLRQPPTAAFDFEIMGNQVFFTDTSYHDIRSWRWDFGDGQVDSVAYPVHGYAESGVYEVCLTVSNPRGQDSVCQEISVIVNDVEELVESKLEILPNPATNELTIVSPLTLERGATLILFDAVGQVVLKKSIHSTELKLDVRHLPAGVYLVQLYAEGKWYREKVVISR